MAVELSTPGVAELDDVVRVLREWQHDAAPMQLHPGDLGWFWRSGAETTAAALRTWSRDKEIVAVAFLDGPALVRMTTAPTVLRDSELGQQIVSDLSEPDRVLPAGRVSVEAPNGALVQDLLLEVGWAIGESWTPLSYDLADPVTPPHLRIEVVGPEQAPSYTAVHRSAFGSPKLTDQRWHTMTSGIPYADARCLLAYDDHGEAVAEATVWSAGPGTPGLLEPLGVHAEHRGRGYGRAISVAAAAALQELGSSSAVVCTPSPNIPAIATYESAGYRRLPERRDRTRDPGSPAGHAG